MAAPVRRDQELELRIDSLAYGGRGVARLNGFVVFVNRALPGDTVRARVTKVKRSHAEAVALPEEGNGHDKDRPLTEAGHAQVGVLAKALHQRGLHLTPVASSPLVRARQTAEGLLHAWGRPTTELLDCPELSPGTRRRKLAKYLTRLRVAHVLPAGRRGYWEDKGYSWYAGL